jgi:hypothetical protein
MKKLFKPACIGFYLLMLVTFFVLGLYYAGMIDAGKNQGLAGGAIVFGWGVLFGGIAFIASFFIAYYAPVQTLVKVNWMLLVFFIAICGYKYYQFQQRDALQEEKNKQLDPAPAKPTKPAEPTGMFIKGFETKYTVDSIAQQEEIEMGMGFFSPNFYENPVLYFYGDPNLEKSLPEHTPYDSITFTRNKHNQFEIATAPPWLVPEILKLDYDMLYFKIESVTQEFAELIVNARNNQTSYVSRRSGNIVYWPDFLLGVNSVEFYPDSKEKVQVRPFKVSATTNVAHQYMRPIRIKGEWMEVLLLNSGFQKVGKGWIQWKRDNKLLVMYNLLS